ncbi:MAG: acyl-CoA synthetase [Pseudomonadales bacterium]|nr:acyl-CoA synthetase [Pseudomonadales bacterium]
MHPGNHPGERIAYVMADSEQPVTYGELDRKSKQAAHLFRHCGLAPGDGIVILLPNHVSYLQICWGAQRAGLYYTPVSTLFQRVEIEYIIDNSDARLLISTTALIEQIDPACLKSLQVYLVDAGPGAAFPDWDQALEGFPTSPIADECEGAEMIYSSGTTGFPKGVRFPLQQAPLGTVSRLFRTRVAMHRIGPDTRYLSTAPLYHSAPLRYNLMVTRLGGTAVIMEKFDAETSLRLIEQHRITHSQWVPTMFARLLRLPRETREKYDLSSLEFAIHAAAPCPVEIKQRMIDWWGPVLYEYYSGTEANGSTAITTEEWLHHKGSVGKAIHGEVHILDDDGNEVPTGEIGTVYFANGSDFSYYKDPEKTAEAKTERGWSTLGDMGYVDEDGYLYLQDRKSFMIISGGVNIYPQEIENLLATHPAVADVAVFGVPNEEFGEEVKAVVQTTQHYEGSAALETELIQWLRERLSHVKCPRSIDFREQLPRHPTGKLYKRILRDEYWQGHASRVL